MTADRCRAATAAAGAFLLFLVQPLAGRALLPSFGGSPATWATCLVFFQATLLAGYGLAHLLSRALPPRRRIVVVVILVAACVPLLPWSLRLGEDPPALPPALAVGARLAVLVGMPAVLLSLTTPLLEASSGVGGVRRLYAWSNAGSLAGLAAQPLVLEPLLGLSRQAELWSAGFVAWSLLLVLALRAAPAEQAATAEGDEPLSARDVLTWGALAAAPSALLVSSTQALTQDVAPVPLLWALPLGAYLLTYVVAFGRVRWAPRWPWLVASAAASLGAATATTAGDTRLLALQAAGILAALTSAGMLCHGELARRSPARGHVTAYYLALAFGGIVGSASVTLLAPLLFDDTIEHGWTLAAPCALVLALVAAARGTPARRRVLAAAAAVLALAVIPPASRIERGDEEHVESARSFFGTLEVVRRPGARGSELVVLRHGTTAHGSQFTDPARQMITTAYYGAASGARAALAERRRSLQGRPLRAGLVGLGAGTLAAAAEPGDSFRFYEIDERVTELARGHFTFLQNCGGCEVVHGDGRLVLRRELAEQGAHGYDVLLVDAFTGDAVPTHLLTREFADLAFAHLAPGGVLGFHVTNRYLDLAPVAAALAPPGWTATVVDSPADRDDATHRARWVLLAEGRSLAETARARGASAQVQAPAAAAWTDEKAPVLSALAWR